MKQLFLLLLMIVCHCNTQGQNFNGGDYKPKPCTENDSIIIVDTVEVDGLLMNTRMTSFEKRNDSILVHVCYHKPGSFIGNISRPEQTKIGKLLKGIYTVVIDGGFRDTRCDSIVDTFFNKITFKMEVLAVPTSISEQVLSPTHLQSTLIQNQLILQALPVHSNILVYDMQGRQCYRKENESEEASIDASTWSSGIYIVSVQAGNERRRWRVVKE